VGAQGGDGVGIRRAGGRKVAMVSARKGIKERRRIYKTREPRTNEGGAERKDSRKTERQKSRGQKPPLSEVADSSSLKIKKGRWGRDQR